MNVLVTGGAGYIGSHAVKRLLAGGARVVVVDDLSRGHRAAVHHDAKFVHADIRDREALQRELVNGRTDAVLHFAALSLVGESVREPELYRSVNVDGSRALLDAMAGAGVERIVFSSSCSVYGEPKSVPIVESAPRAPVSPYGDSKARVEDMLAATGGGRDAFGWTALRYFNVAGCDIDGDLGEDHTPETHLIPLVLQAALGQRPEVAIFGADYPTPDGTCVRDYVHVDDLVDAHISALQRLTPGCADRFNLGIGRGFSVREVIDSVRRVTNAVFAVVARDRRPGDPPELWADATAARAALGWRPQHTDLDEIVQTAWRWMCAHPDGYAD